jgi:hypothetical protein
VINPHPLVRPIGEAGIFLGPLFHAKFNLPKNLDTQELAVIHCRIKHNEINNKMFFINHKPLPDILEPHPKVKDEWMMDIAIVPKGWLKAGINNIHIGYADERFDDFAIDNIVLWYKMKELSHQSKDQAPEEQEQRFTKDIDALEDLSTLNINVNKDSV